MITALYCIIFGLIAIIFILLVQAYKERKDLYNRIMCKSIQEYKNIDVPPIPVKSKHDKIMEDWRKKED